MSECPFCYDLFPDMRSCVRHCLRYHLWDDVAEEGDGKDVYLGIHDNYSPKGVNPGFFRCFCGTLYNAEQMARHWESEGGPAAHFLVCRLKKSAD